MEQIAAQEPMIQRAMTIEEAFMKSESERYLYELREKGRNDYYNAMSTAEKRGMEKGMEKATFEIAKNFLVNGVPPDVIARNTGLSEEQIRALAN